MIHLKGYAQIVMEEMKKLFFDTVVSSNIETLHMPKIDCQFHHPLHAAVAESRLIESVAVFRVLQTPLRFHSRKSVLYPGRYRAIAQ